MPSDCRGEHLLRGEQAEQEAADDQEQPPLEQRADRHDRIGGSGIGAAGQVLHRHGERRFDREVGLRARAMLGSTFR
ncbi:hypothetical protein ACFSTI_05675 [Rhizorhabdus histidinilytica]